MKPLRWGRLRDQHGKWWRVLLSCEADAPELAEADGWTFFASRTVLVDAGLTRDEQDEILLHEILHVAYDDSEGKLGTAEAEERFIRMVTRPLLTLLRQFGLRFPRRPRGMRALELRARCVEDEEEE